jgi:hypothetical protein
MARGEGMAEGSSCTFPPRSPKFANIFFAKNSSWAIRKQNSALDGYSRSTQSPPPHTHTHSARVGTHERGAEHDLGVVLVHARAARELDAVVLDADLQRLGCGYWCEGCGFCDKGTDMGVKGAEFAIRVRILV